MRLIRHRLWGPRYLAIVAIVSVLLLLPERVCARSLCTDMLFLVADVKYHALGILPPNARLRTARSWEHFDAVDREIWRLSGEHNHSEVLSVEALDGDGKVLWLSYLIGDGRSVQPGQGLKRLLEEFVLVDAYEEVIGQVAKIRFRHNHPFNPVDHILPTGAGHFNRWDRVGTYQVAAVLKQMYGFTDIEVEAQMHPTYWNLFPEKFKGHKVLPTGEKTTLIIPSDLGWAPGYVPGRRVRKDVRRFLELRGGRPIIAPEVESHGVQ